jgi:hypothetical protein
LTEWKVVCSLILTPLNFLPLRFLSFTSVIGIFSCFSSKSWASTFPHCCACSVLLTRLEFGSRSDSGH